MFGNHFSKDNDMFEYNRGAEIESLLRSINKKLDALQPSKSKQINCECKTTKKVFSKEEIRELNKLTF